MKNWHLIALLALVAVSCKMADGFQDAANVLFRGEVVARVGRHTLHRSQLEAYIPSGVSPEDSAGLKSSCRTKKRKCRRSWNPIVAPC